MDLKELLSGNAVFIDSPASNKKEAIEMMISVLKREGRISDERKFSEDIFKRESEMSTDFFEGIAIPHAKSSAVSRASIAAVKLKKPVKNDIDGGAPVNLMFLIASPCDEKAHLEALSKLSGVLLGDGVCDSLRNSKTTEEFLSALSEKNGFI